MYILYIHQNYVFQSNNQLRTRSLQTTPATRSYTQTTQHPTPSTRIHHSNVALHQEFLHTSRDRQFFFDTLEKENHTSRDR